jgi:5-(carboxyamino)imidazole ribonucleotide synthase
MIKAGILGGGQLGRMLLQEAANYPVEVSVMEKDPLCPSAKLCHHFILGDITNYDDVIRFGEGLDVITIEIENVNVEALFELEKRGCRVIPKPEALRTIKNKILQKEFYTQHQIPTALYKVLQNRDELKNNIDFLPAVHKLATGGYDGKGVQIIKKQEDIPLGFDAPAVLEKMISIEKEIAIIVAVAENGKTAIYPPVEMFFDPILNLLDLQLCPASIPEKTLWKAEAIALTVARKLDSPGIFAIEMFVDKEGTVWVNETAPRVHNSGHHTIEAHYSSQFDMLWRIIMNYPLGNTTMIMSSMMVNLLGAEGYAGKTHYEGLEDILSIPDVFVHLYGKTDTKPGRKMGHVTIVSSDYQELRYKANKIKNTLKVISE